MKWHFRFHSSPIECLIKMSNLLNAAVVTPSPRRRTTLAFAFDQTAHRNNIELTVLLFVFLQHPRCRHRHLAFELGVDVSHILRIRIGNQKTKRLSH